MIDVNTIISESLSPAVAISGMGLLAFGLNNRISTIGTRVRDLAHELRGTCEPRRRHNIEQQIPLFLMRARLVRNAMFFLFTALGLMVLTAVAITLQKLHFHSWQWVPATTFLLGLGFMLMALMIESYEIIVNLKTLDIEVEDVNGQP